MPRSVVIAALFVVAASAACTVKITDQKSSHKCELGTDYGCYDANSSM